MNASAVSARGDSAPDPRVFEYARSRATKDGNFLHRVFAEMLLWPKVTRGCPDYSRDYAEHWAERVSVAKGLAPSTAAAVLQVIIAAMQRDPKSNRFACFLSQATIARRAHVGVRTVARVIAWQKDAPAPLVEITMDEQTFGYKHKGLARFTLIERPLEFAGKRDVARARHVEEFRARWDERRPQYLELQQRHLRNDLTEEEYECAIAQLKTEARGTLPKRVEVPRGCRPNGRQRQQRAVGAVPDTSEASSLPAWQRGSARPAGGLRQIGRR